MNILTWVLLLMAVAAPVGAWWILFVQLPDLAHTNYRIELRDIHDDLLEMIHAGRVRPTSPVVEMLHDIEGLIRSSDRQTVLRVLLAMRTMDPARQSHGTNLLVDDRPLAGLPQAEQDYLRTAIVRARQAINRHLQTGSVAGWVLMVPVRASAGPAKGKPAERFYLVELAAAEHAEGRRLHPV
jgi:hypothetical protein